MNIPTGVEDPIELEAWITLHEFFAGESTITEAQKALKVISAFTKKRYIPKPCHISYAIINVLRSRLIEGSEV